MSSDKEDSYCRSCYTPQTCAVNGRCTERHVVSTLRTLQERSELPVIEQDSAKRKDMPMARGLLDYFPAALAEVARVSKLAGDKHHPGEEFHHERGKSTDHADCIVRHLVERGSSDTITVDGVERKIRHSACLAWRALALLQQELEDDGEVRMPRGAR